MPIEEEERKIRKLKRNIITAKQEWMLSVNQDNIPITKIPKQILPPSEEEEQVSLNSELESELNSEFSSQNFYAPFRNYHVFSVLSHNDDNVFYFSPNYDYLRHGAFEYEPVVYTSDEEYSGVDKYSIFSSQDDGILKIEYYTNQESSQDTYNTYQVLEEDKTLKIDYFTQSEDLQDKYSIFSVNEEEEEEENSKILNINYNN